MLLNVRLVFLSGAVNGKIGAAAFAAHGRAPRGAAGRHRRHSVSAAHSGHFINADVYMHAGFH